ncbi:MAG TPA: hypothetical protein VF777_12830 [Phycisphaerales bacterium]
MIGAAHTPLLPPWVVLPVAVVMLLVVAVHLLVITHAPMPESRRRIRLANGWIMLLLVPLGAAAFGVVTPGDPRTFLIVWLLVIFMLIMLIVLATLDVFNTGRLYRRERRSIERSLGPIEEDGGDGTSARSPDAGEESRRG